MLVELFALLAAATVSTSVGVVGFSDDGARALLRHESNNDESGTRRGRRV